MYRTHRGRMRRASLPSLVFPNRTTTLIIGQIMTNPHPPAPRVAVIGGGISGLAAAHRLCELSSLVRVTLYESQDRLGGVLQTVRQDGYLIEWGADNFITNVPWGVELCRRIGFADQLATTNSEHRHAFVVRRSKLHKIPDGFIIMAPSRIWPVVTTPIFSPLGKLRMAWEYFVPQVKQSDEQDESLAAFVIRRFGRETYERLVQPLIGGIYTGDPEKLSLQATMPRFLEMERKHGSLIRAMWKQMRQRPTETKGTSGARYSLFVAPRGGMCTLIDALATRLPSDTIQLDAPVNAVTPGDRGGWDLLIGGDRPGTHHCDAVIFATPATAVANLTAPLDPQLADEFRGIPHASCSIVSVAYRREQIGHRLDGFGFVVPLVENRQILSGSFSSVKYAGRAPDGSTLLRVFIGGECQPTLADLPDDDLIRIATAELAELLDVRGNPQFAHVIRQPHAMPQYYVGHGQRLARIQAGLARQPGLFLTGNMFDGVGIPHCIHHGERVAGEVVAALRCS
jgi:protoporphyrinogen/coproporphyrinogen III oxidase